MELALKRRWFTERSTIGELFVDGVFECYVLEDATRPPDEKVFGETCIPVGRYPIIINHSPRFGVDMPLLLDVPGFQGVRIHPGNKPDDTEGCLLVGRQMTQDAIMDSRLAYESLFPKLVASVEPIHITVTKEP
jgi:hypothetical protein